MNLSCVKIEKNIKRLKLDEGFIELQGWDDMSLFNSRESCQNSHTFIKFVNGDTVENNR